MFMIKKKIIQPKEKPKQRPKLTSRLQDNPTSLKISVRKIGTGHSWIVQDWFGITMAQGKKRTWEEAKAAAGEAKRQLRADALAQIAAAKKKRAEQGEKESTIFEQKGIAFGREFE